MRRFKVRLSESIQQQEEVKPEASQGAEVSQGAPNLLQRVEKRFEPLERQWELFREKKYIGVLCIILGVVGTILVIFHDVSDVPVGSALSKVSETVEPSSDLSKMTEKKISFSWIEPDRLLASTPELRSQAAKALGIDKGEWVVALISISCGNCDREVQKLNWMDMVAAASEREAMKLNRVEGTPKVMAVTVGPQNEIDEWKKRLGIKYQVVNVTQEQFESFGAVILPTIVHFKDGQAVGTTERAEVSKVPE